MILLSEASRRIGVSTQTLKNWYERGIINIKKMGRAYYVDADLIEQIGDIASDVEKTRLELEQLKADYSKEMFELEQLRKGLLEERNDLNDRRRYLNLCVNSSIRNKFFQTVVSILECNGSLKQKECDVLRLCLEGQSLEAIAFSYGLSRERIRQIVDKAIRKSRELQDLQDIFDVIHKQRSDNDALKSVVRDLRGKIRVQDEVDRLAAEKSLEEKRKQIIENDKICKLLNTKIVDCQISVRSLNCLKSVDVETIGDLCRLKKTDFLKIRNAGKKSLIELDDFLIDHGLEWGTDVDKVFKERVDAILSQEEDTL